MDIKGQRKDYPAQGIKKENLSLDPFVQLENWLQEAKEKQVPEFNAMALATASKKGLPSCRMVLLKHFDSNGLVFYTNYESRKAKELEENPNASAVIFWHELVRQVCIEGKVEKISPQASLEYFATRPRGSQIAAWASHQDTPLFSRDYLENDYIKIEKKFDGKEIPIPPFWGGFRLIPSRFEFWQGRKNRLHDRFAYSSQKGAWKVERLSP